ncbi:MAG: NAD(P)/FAD-dependent oxidoreductase [Bacillota bacterium]
MMDYDVVIIGGGILGTTVARELSRYKLDTVVVEKAYDLGEGATKANSAVLGAGFHPRGGSLKGISCVQGNKMYRRICSELGVKVDYIGSLMVAFHPEGIDAIQEKMKKGIKNGAEGLRLIDGDSAREMQPGLSDRVLKALYAPSTGIIDIFQLLIRTAQNAAENGVEFKFCCNVEHIERLYGGFLIHTDRGSITARYVVNTAGENAAAVESWLRPADLIIKPRKGQFYVFDKQPAGKIKYVLYQAQETDEKGCLLAPTVEGNILAGPTSEDVSGYERVETTSWGLKHIEKIAKKILPEIDMGDVIASFGGVRANIKNVAKEEKDFVVRRSIPGMISTLGIKNPGMTSAPYLAKMVVEMLVQDGLGLEENILYHPGVLSAGKKFLESSTAEQAAMIKDDPRYGNIVCRCEQVTEGDIVRVLHEPLPPKSLNGLKKRLRCGMGRCQGGFCTPRILEILSREWKTQPQLIFKSTKGSNPVKGRVK